MRTSTSPERSFCLPVGRQGWTLLELLVAIGILGALSGLVFGVLGPAREKGREAVCGQQMHQIGKALFLYMADYGGVEPVRGVRMQYWQVGFPPNYHFLWLYKLTPIERCPSETRVDPPGVKSIRGYPALSLAGEGEQGADYLAAQGTRFPLTVCASHGNEGKRVKEPWDVPDWFQFRVRALRYDQSLSWTRVPARRIPPHWLW